MIKNLKRKYHYHMAIAYRKLSAIIAVKFYYHTDRHKEIAEQMKEE